MTLLEVHHTTIYRYARAVRFGQHRAMLRPRDSHDLKLRSATLAVSPRAEVRWVHDVFGNSITLLDFQQPAAELRIESWIEIQPFALDTPRLQYRRGCRALAVRLWHRGAPRSRADPRAALSRR